jgi:hypothetical protein
MLTNRDITRIKGLMDPTYAIENYLETLIKHKKGLYHSNYSPDKRDYTCLRKHRFNLVTKPRQAEYRQQQLLICQ